MMPMLAETILRMYTLKLQRWMRTFSKQILLAMKDNYQIVRIPSEEHLIICMKNKKFYGFCDGISVGSFYPENNTECRHLISYEKFIRVYAFIENISIQNINFRGGGRMIRSSRSSLAIQWVWSQSGLHKFLSHYTKASSTVYRILTQWNTISYWDTMSLNELYMLCEINVHPWAG